MKTEDTFVMEKASIVFYECSQCINNNIVDNRDSRVYGIVWFVIGG